MAQHLRSDVAEAHARRFAGPCAGQDRNRVELDRLRQPLMDREHLVLPATAVMVRGSG